MTDPQKVIDALNADAKPEDGRVLSVHATLFAPYGEVSQTSYEFSDLYGEFINLIVQNKGGGSHKWPEPIPFTEDDLQVMEKIRQKRAKLKEDLDNQSNAPEKWADFSESQPISASEIANMSELDQKRAEIYNEVLDFAKNLPLDSESLNTDEKLCNTLVPK